MHRNTYTTSEAQLTNEETTMWIQRHWSTQFGSKKICQNQMSETHGRPSTMVPTAHKGHCTNIVLERDTEMHKTWTHQSPIPPTSGQKGGVTYQLEHMQLVTATIKSRIRQAYKLYLRLKNDTGRRDTWIKQLVEAQAQDQKVTKKSIWKKICREDSEQCTNDQIGYGRNSTKARLEPCYWTKPIWSHPMNRIKDKNGISLSHRQGQ